MTMITAVPGKSILRLAMTNSANFSIMPLWSLGVTLLALTGNTINSAGNTVIAKTKASMTPIATMFPKSRNGGESEKFILKKPMAVVTLVNKIGLKLTCKLYNKASFFGFP